MQNNIYEFDPSHLTSLIVFLYKRNQAVNYPNPTMGFIGDLFDMYVGYQKDKEYYEDIIKFYKNGTSNKLNKLQQLIEEAKAETNFIKQKSLLIQIVELQKELEYFHSLEE